MGKHTKHPMWKAFWKWAEWENIDRRHEEDWEPWWSCFVSGAEAAIAVDERAAEESP